jgi:hypothetical protein
MKKIIVLTIIFLSLSLPILARELEIDYPTIPGTEVSLQTVEGTGLSDYVKYIFNFALWIMGVVAFGVLAYAGFRYFTSAGNPGKQSDSKKQIFAAFLGIIILLCSYIILTTINPQLVIFEVSGLKEVAISPSSPILSPLSPDILARIKAIALAVDALSSDIKRLSADLITAVRQCNCSFTSAECDCLGLDCTPVRCYGDPCPNREEIIALQRKITEKLDEILYYRNRIIAEEEDLGPELKRLDETAAEELIENLDNLIILIEGIEGPTQKIIDLPSSCLMVDGDCKATCSEETCHNSCAHKVTGCPPEGCKGGNPCPVGAMETALGEISGIQENISQNCQKIISIL